MKLLSKDNKKMKIIACLLMLVSISCNAEKYLCVADKASGFQFNNSVWDSVTFETENKYLVGASKFDRFPLEVNIVGHDIPVIMCKEGFNSGGFLHCDSGGPMDMLGISFGELFTMNSKSLRFMRTVPRGYVNVVPGNNISDESGGTPFIEIGKCTAL